MDKIKQISVNGTLYEVQDENALPKAGGTITGNLAVQGTIHSPNTTIQWVDISNVVTWNSTIVGPAPKLLYACNNGLITFWLNFVYTGEASFSTNTICDSIPTSLTSLILQNSINDMVYFNLVSAVGEAPYNYGCRFSINVNTGVLDMKEAPATNMSVVGNFIMLAK